MSRFGKLNERQIKYGFDYLHKDEPHPKMVVEVSEYNGETELSIKCTQLGDEFTPEYKTAREKKRVLHEWCDFLTNNTNAFSELTFGTRMPQELFDAVCSQRNLRKLYIKWGVYPDISKIANLENLEYLHIESGASMIYRNMETFKALSADRVLKVGDTISDIREGKNAGVYTVGVIEGSFEMALTQTEYEALDENEKTKKIEEVKNKFLEAGADAVILNMSELVALL